MAGGIQGSIADVTVAILRVHDVKPIIKWVNDFVFFHSPLNMTPPSLTPSFKFGLQDILNVTAPLGIPWHPISHKGHNFKPSFSYVGFEWDLSTRSVSLSSEKRLHLLSKISVILSKPSVCLNRKAVTSIHGSLQHITLVYHHGCHYLPTLSMFLSKFPNDFIVHHLPRSCLQHLEWWAHTLTIPNPARTLVHLPESDLIVWVDASSSWGIGLIVNNCWATWKLANGWCSHLRDIGWAEVVVIKMAVMWLTRSGLHDCSIKINCDNSSVIDSFWKGRSHNPERNQSLIHITANLATFNLTINLCYMPSAQNEVDSLSCGTAGADGLHLVPHVVVPEPLCPFLAPI